MDNNKWTEVLRSNDSKAFWKLVDWKGSMKHKKTLNSPTMQQFEVFFADAGFALGQNLRYGNTFPYLKGYTEVRDQNFRYGNRYGIGI